MQCPKCGSNNGFYTKFQAEQYYDCNGEPCGTSDYMDETQYAWCVKCDKKILLSRIKKNKEKENIDSCSLIRKMGTIPPQSNGLCVGFAKSEYNDEPCEQCKECKLNMFYEE